MAGGRETMDQHNRVALPARTGRIVVEAMLAYFHEFASHSVSHGTRGLTGRSLSLHIVVVTRLADVLWRSRAKALSLASAG